MLKLKEMQNFRREGGITLIALIITIIILVILAAVSINAAYNSGIINYAVNGTQNYIEAAKKEQERLSNVEELTESVIRSIEESLEVNSLVTTPITSWEYTISGSDVILTQYIGSDPKILIPNTFSINGETYNTVLDEYTNVKPNGPLANNNVITHVKFGNNVIVVNNSGYALFYSSKNLEKVYNYPKGITTLTSAFGKTKVSKIPDIPEGVTSIASILWGVTTVEEFPKISSTVTRINGAFKGCTSISGNLYVYSDNITNATDAFQEISNYYTVYVNENTTSYETLSNALTVYGSINEEHREAQIIRIIAWGDSLTAGSGGNGTSYRSVLDSLIQDGHIISNGGVGGESSRSIAARQGGNAIYVNAFTIPANTTNTEITIHDVNNNNIVLARQGTYALNPVYINGIKGNITYNSDTSKYYFSRSKAGNQIQISANTQIITDGMQKNRDDLMIIWAGTNDRPTTTTIQNVISNIDSMIQYSNNANYIVIGLTSKDFMSDIVEVNETLAQKYGNHFLDIRTYILEHGLQDAGITATEQDNTDIENGEIPTSLRADEVHFNASGYTIVGTQVYNKLIALGYIEE